MVEERTAADIVAEKLFKHITKVFIEFLNKHLHKRLGCCESLKTRLNTRDDSYCFRIRSSICGKIQRHRMDFELQILFSIHFLY